MQPLPSINAGNLVKTHRVGNRISFRDLIGQKLSFKIPVTCDSYINEYPAVFQRGLCEYGFYVDNWLRHDLINLTSETSVVALDTCWQSVLKHVAGLMIYVNQKDASSQIQLRPDFVGLSHGRIFIKGEAKATQSDMGQASDELVDKFHKTAKQLFPAGCDEIPGITTCNERAELLAISYRHDTEKFVVSMLAEYNLSDINHRIRFVQDIFHICRWVVSQTVETTPILRLIPTMRVQTRNGHHVTFSSSGILKEFAHQALTRIRMDLIKKVYDAKLANVEHGVANHRSVTITRVGCRLADGLRSGIISKEKVLAEVAQAMNQLHALGLAHCDICCDNVFVDIEAPYSAFLGDLEYLCPMNSSPPIGIKRMHEEADNAQSLDSLQYKTFIDELASL